MVRIPCHCKVYLPSKCKCQLRQPGYRLLGADHVVYTQSFSLHDRTNTTNPRRLYELKEESNTNLVEKSQMTMECFYDACTGYNLSYCPITGFVKNKRDYFKLKMKDVAVLICFLASNFIVFLTIVFKTIVHSFLLVIMGLQWILSVFIAKASSACMGGVDSYWPTRTEELIRTLGLHDGMPIALYSHFRLDRPNTDQLEASDVRRRHLTPPSRRDSELQYEREDDRCSIAALRVPTRSHTGSFTSALASLSGPGDLGEVHVSLSL